MTTIRESAALVAAIAYLAAILTVRLSTFPNVHADEAWVGLLALRLHAEGLYTPHGMNPYSSPLFSWLVSQAWQIFEPGVASLRMLGVFANVAAVAVVAMHFRRRLGAAQAASWLFIVAATPMLLIKSRVAWEVYALQNILLATLLVLLERMLSERRYPFGRALAFSVIVEVGVLNHGIFVSIPVSLAVFAALMLIFDAESRLEPLLRLAVLSFIAAALPAAAKTALSDAGWQAHRPAYLVVLAALPVAASAVFVATARADGWIRAQLGVSAPQHRRFLAGLTAAGLAAFVIVHLKALVEIMSGVVIFERVVAWVPPWWLRLLLTTWAVLLLALFASRAIETFRRRGDGRISDYERLLALWPIAYLAIFSTLRITSSIRYFAILNFLLMASSSVALTRMLDRRRFLLALGALAIITTHVQLWREIRTPQQRPTIRFRVGWTPETSRHFGNLDALYRIVDDEGLCRFQTDDFFVQRPLEFHVALRARPCSSATVLEVSSCDDCRQPPFARWRLR